MLTDTPFETIRRMVVVLLASSAKLHLRSFAVGKRGKGRDIAAAGSIARTIGPRLVYPLAFFDGDQPADEKEITAEIEAVLLSIDNDLAPNLVSKNSVQREEAHRTVGKMAAERLTSQYRVEKVDRSADWHRPSTGTGKWYDTDQMAP